MRLFSTAMLAALVLGFSTQAPAQDKSDKTGTNPINFTYDFRI